ncbi:hypothetical protein ACQWF4_23490, partial [Salmonella enterica subsp. enterica serovar Infantis]
FFPCNNFIIFLTGVGRYIFTFFGPLSGFLIGYNLGLGFGGGLVLFFLPVIYLSRTPAPVWFYKTFKKPVFLVWWGLV